jgi:hypothetical protein
MHLWRAPRVTSPARGDLVTLHGKRRTTGMKKGMEESYIEDLANHDGPDHALATREGAAKRWIRGARRPAIEPRNVMDPGCRRGHGRRKATLVAALSRAVIGPRGVGEPVHARDLFMPRTGRSRGRPCLADDAPSWMVRGVADRRVAGREGNAKGDTPSMNGCEKSDRLVVPVKLPNNAASAVAEAVEGRGLREGNAVSKTRSGLRAGRDAPSALVCMRRIAGVRGSTPLPERGAQCGSSARWDLCGGRAEP